MISRLFRGKFLAGLRAAYDSGAFCLALLPPRWRERPQFQQCCRELSERDWVVYQQSPPPDLEPTALVKYLARYVSGVAISDQRLVSCESGQVTFTVKNRAKKGRREERTVGAAEFVSRYLQHVLPAGLTRSRRYGLLSCRNAVKREHCRTLLLTASASASSAASAGVGVSAPSAVAAAASGAPSVVGAVTAAAIPTVRRSGPGCRRCGQSGVRVLVESENPRWKVRQSPLCTQPAPRLSVIPPRSDCVICVSSRCEELRSEWVGNEWVLSELSESEKPSARWVAARLAEWAAEEVVVPEVPAGEDSS